MVQFIEQLSVLPITVDSSTGSRSMHTILALAFQEELSIYDASYLELALREEIPLLTLDNALLKAARNLKIAVHL